MKLRLEWDDQPAFATVRHPLGSDFRSMVVKINGKPFSVWTQIDVLCGYGVDDKDYIAAVDEALVKAMERMFTKLFMDACAAVPEGTDLLIGGPKP